MPIEIEVTEETVQHEGRDYYKGVQPVADDVAKLFCAMGWAKATDGSIETVERSLAPKVISPDLLTQTQSTSEVK